MDTDKEIFSGKSLGNLFEDIYNNQNETKTQVKGMISELKPLIENIGDATLVVPMIKGYMELMIKNDDALIKLATIIQRMESVQAKGESLDGFDFTELQDLLEDQEDIKQEVEKEKEQPKDNDE